MEATSPPLPFLLDTSGHCLLCLTKPVKSTSTLSGEDPALKTLSFQDLCRYLKTDLKEVFSDTLSFSSPAELERSELKGTLCGGCAQIVEGFSAYLAELEGIKRKLKTCLKSIHGRMVQVDGGVGGDDDKGQVRKLEEFRTEMLRKPYTSFQFGIVSRLRTMTMDNCSKLLEATQEDPTHTQPIVKEEVITADLDETPMDISETMYCPPPGTTPPDPEKDTIMISSKAPDSFGLASTSSLGGGSSFLHKCNMCPKTFPTYQARLAHQRACPKKLGCQPLKKPNISPTKKKRPSLQRTTLAQERVTSVPKDTFILPDVDLPETGPGSEISTTPPPSRHWQAHCSSNPITGQSQCRVCSNWYSSRTTFRAHFIRVHLDASVNCEECGKQVSKLFFRQHQQVHQGAAMVKCNICNKLFNCVPSLDEHRQTIHFGNLYRCKYCFVPFKTPAGRTNHLKVCEAISKT